MNYTPLAKDKKKEIEKRIVVELSVLSVQVSKRLFTSGLLTNKGGRYGSMLPQFIVNSSSILFYFDL